VQLIDHVVRDMWVRWQTSNHPGCSI